MLDLSAFPVPLHTPPTLPLPPLPGWHPLTRPQPGTSSSAGSRRRNPCTRVSTSGLWSPQCGLKITGLSARFHHLLLTISARLVMLWYAAPGPPLTMWILAASTLFLASLPLPHHPLTLPTACCSHRHTHRHSCLPSPPSSPLDPSDLHVAYGEVHHLLGGGAKQRAVPPVAQQRQQQLKHLLDRGQKGWKSERCMVEKASGSQLEREMPCIFQLMAYFNLLLLHALFRIPKPTLSPTLFTPAPAAPPCPPSRRPHQRPAPTDTTDDRDVGRAKACEEAVQQRSFRLCAVGKALRLAAQPQAGFHT